MQMHENLSRRFQVDVCSSIEVISKKKRTVESVPFPDVVGKWEKLALNCLMPLVSFYFAGTTFQSASHKYDTAYKKLSDIFGSLEES